MINYILDIRYPEGLQQFRLWCNDAGYFQMEVTQFDNGFSAPYTETFDIELQSTYLSDAIDEMFRQIKVVVIEYDDVYL